MTRWKPPAGLRRRARHAPRVSVVIASYRWPEVVVREAHDSRARWLKLRDSSGSQSGPNTLGRRKARAPVVAYLGHDDIWHPAHLAQLLSVLEPTVDAAHSVTLYLGAQDDGRVMIAGSTPWEPTTFVPPSSLAHWRDSPRVGSWVAPGDTGMPVDYAFLMSCRARGARFAASRAATTFKYPASWRLDSYRTRDVTPQLRLRERLAVEPQLGQQLVRDALAAGISPVMAAPPPAAPGVIQDYTRRLKGLPARFAPRVTAWAPSPFLTFPGWHRAERDAGGSYAWSGPQQRAIVRLDSPGDGELGVRIVVRHALVDRQLEELACDLDGEAVVLARSPGPLGATVMTGSALPSV